MSKIDDIVEMLKESTAEDNYFELWIHDARGLQTTIKEQSAEIANLKTLAQAVMTEYACGDGVDNLHPELRAAFRALAKALEVDR
jgi:hypothetical protein